MSFQFSGFFVKKRVPRDINKHKDVEKVVAIDKPFSGVGISVPKFISKDPTQDELLALASNLGITDGLDWMFIVYECFGGQIDYLFGYQNKNSQTFGPVQDSALDTVENSYIEFMHNFGVGKNKAIKFVPFERGYFE